MQLELNFVGTAANLKKPMMRDLTVITLLLCFASCHAAEMQANQTAYVSYLMEDALRELLFDRVIELRPLHADLDSTTLDKPGQASVFGISGPQASTAALTKPWLQPGPRAFRIVSAKAVSQRGGAFQSLGAVSQRGGARGLRSSAPAILDRKPSPMIEEDGAEQKVAFAKGPSKKAAENAAAIEFVKIFVGATNKPAKAELNDWAFRQGLGPTYITERTGGTSHNPVFSSMCTVQELGARRRGEPIEATETAKKFFTKERLAAEKIAEEKALEAVASFTEARMAAEDAVADAAAKLQQIQEENVAQSDADLEDAVMIDISKEHENLLQIALDASSVDFSLDAKEMPGEEDVATEGYQRRQHEARVPPPLGPGALKLRPVRESLPAFEYRSRILKGIRENQVIIVEGETGCGKTTQVGQFIIEDAAENNLPCSAVCTQPRRISAIGVAERVADERGERLGGTVGYSVRQDRRAGPNTHLLFCTTGILLRRLESDATLQGTTHVVVDEVHERGIESDFLLLALRDLAKRRSDLKIIMMSATMDKDLFGRYFGTAHYITIPGRTFPVQDFFLEDALQITKYRLNPDADWAIGRGVGLPQNKNKHFADAKKLEDLSMGAVMSRYGRYDQEVQRTLVGIDQDAINYDLITSLIEGSKLEDLANTRPEEQIVGDGVPERPNGVLVFMSGAKEIERLQLALLNTREFSQEPARSWVLPLHGGLPPDDQKKVFLHPPPGVRKIVISTNVAETAITIDDIGYVVDACRMKEMRFDAVRRVSSLEDTVVSRTNARQRRGRAGRVAPGVAVHVGLTKFRHDYKVDDHQPPEVRRVPLEQLVLRIHATGLHMRDGGGRAANVCAKLLEPPEWFFVKKSVEELVRLGAIEVDRYTGQESLTPLGKHLANLPLEARLGKLVLFGAAFGPAATDAALTIAAALTSRNPFLAPLDMREKAAEAKMRFGEEMVGGPIGLSDHLAVLAAYNEWDQMPLQGGRRIGWCRTNFLSGKTLKLMSDMKRSLLVTLSEAGFVRSGITLGGIGSYSRRYGNDGVLPALVQGDRVEPCPPVLVAALLCMALFPQVVTATMPRRNSQPKSRNAQRNVEREGEVKPRYMVKDAKTGEPVRVKLHPGSVSADETTLSSPFLVYQELVSSNPWINYVRDVTPVPPLALALFGGSLVDSGCTVGTNPACILIVDSWIKFAVPPFLRDSLFVVRQRLDALFDGWVAERGQEDNVQQYVLVERSGSHLLEAVVELLNAQDETSPLQRPKTQQEKEQAISAARKALEKAEKQVRQKKDQERGALRRSLKRQTQGKPRQSQKRVVAPKRAVAPRLVATRAEAVTSVSPTDMVAPALRRLTEVRTQGHRVVVAPQQASVPHDVVNGSPINTDKVAPTNAAKVKRGRTAYSLFAADKSIREAIQREHPDWKFGDISKEIGAKWKAMDEVARQPYVDQSNAEKASMASVPVA